MKLTEARVPGFLLAPWHVVLSAACPVLVFLRGSGSGATPRTGLWSAAAVLALVLVSCLTAVLLVRSVRRAALLMTVLALASFGYFAVADPAYAIAPSAILMPIAYLAAAAALVVIVRCTERTLAMMTLGANVALLTIAAVNASLYTRDELRVSRDIALETPLPLPISITRPEAERPDIFILDLEGYAREDVLRQYYGFENGLVEELRSLGFFVADRAAGNYPQMGQALAAALNVAYLPSLLRAPESSVNLRRRMGELIAANRFFATLHAAGYRITSYESEYAFARPRPADARPGPLVRFTNFDYRMYEGTIFPHVFQRIGLRRGIVPLHVHHHQVLWTLDHFAAEPSTSDGRPNLVFAHVLTPHPPFVFEADGRVRSTNAGMGFNDGDQWRRLTHGTGERYETGYTDAVRFLNSRVPDVVRAVLRREKRPTIFCVFSDHGPASRLQWENPDVAGVRERLGILFAIRLSAGNPAALDSEITPVNAFRIILNSALGGDLPMLENRSYFSTWERLSIMTDVTAQVR